MTAEWKHPLEVEWTANGREQILSALRDPNTATEVLKGLDTFPFSLTERDKIITVLNAAADLLTSKEPT